MITLGSYETLKDTFEYINENVSDDFLRDIAFYGTRDNFYDLLKYEVISRKISKEDAFNRIREKPEIEDFPLLFCYSAAYCEWIANELHLDIPSWVYDDSTYQFSNCFIASMKVMKSAIENESNITYPSDEFSSRGFYVQDKDQQVC